MKRWMVLCLLLCLLASLAACDSGAGFEAKLLKELAALEGESSFYYKNLDTGEIICKDMDIAMPSASLIQLPIMLEVYYQADEGKLSLSDRVTLDAKDLVGGDGIIRMLDDEAELSLEDLVTFMIVQGDISATNRLMDIVGIENVNARMAALGLEHTQLHNKLMLAPAVFDKKNTTSAHDMARLFEMLYYGEIVDRAASDEMLELMAQRSMNDKLAFHIQAYAPMAHITGDASTISHDAGIVFSGVPYIICAMSEDVDPSSFNAHMRDLSLKVYQHTMPSHGEQTAASWKSNVKDDPKDKIVMAWDLRCIQDVSSLPQSANVLAPVWIDLKVDMYGEPYTELMKLDHQRYVNDAHLSGKEVWVTVASFNKECNEQLVLNEAFCSKICESIKRFVLDNNVDGVCLDFEYMNPANKEAYTAFVRFLSEMLPTDIKLSACVTVQIENTKDNWNQCYDHKGLAEVCDYICLMTYDQYGASSKEAGPVAALDWTEFMLRRELLDVPSDKLILGVPFYYYAYPYRDGVALWPDTDVSLFTWAILQSIEETGEYIDKHGETIVPEILEDGINKPSGMRLLKFQDQHGITRICYADNEESLLERCDMIHTYHLKGAGVWMADFGTDAQWALLRQYVMREE